MQYAAFMRRVGAFLIDLLIVPILWLAALFGIGLAFGLVAGFLGTSEETDERFLDTLIGPLAVVLMAAVPILYAAVLEAGAGGHGREASAQDQCCERRREPAPLRPCAGARGRQAVLDDLFRPRVPHCRVHRAAPGDA
jgi:O-antigen ligase